MKRKKYKTKTFLISFVLSFAFSLTILIPTLTMILIDKISSSNTPYLQYKNFNMNETSEMLMRSRTLSLFFAKKHSGLSYDGVYGTGWVIPNGIRHVTDNSLSCYIATNIHVISDFVDITHSADYNYSSTLNNNFDVLFVKYFTGQNYKNLVGNNLTERQFIDKNNINVKKMFIDNNPIYDDYYEYPYPIGTTTKNNVNNRMSEISIIELKINNENPQLFNWALNIKNLDERPIGFLSDVPRIDFLNMGMNQYEANPWEKIESIYVGGFPVFSYNTQWISFGFSETSGINYEYKTNYFFEKNNFANPQIGNKLNINLSEKYFKNISLQLIIPTLNIGKGSSGSMLIAKIKNDPIYRIIGIWWGVYEIYHLNNHKIKGAADLFITNNDYFIDEELTDIKWPAYNYVSIINQLL